jgi:2-polyprenyl-3-methyl-5-hydroxy-6-metoxy-1,4-benzoquinol methylase
VSDRELARSTLACFDRLPRRDRWHVRGRWKSCPVPLVEAEVPAEGRVLEVGCGHGLVSVHLALVSPERVVVGTDIDERKIELARRAGEAMPAHRPAFVHGHDGELPPGPWDAIVVVDVLYLLSRDDELRLLDRCIDALAPGGVLVVKETDVRPRWKHVLAKLQEVVATRVLRITKGVDLSFTPIAQLCEHLRARGLEVQVRRVDRGYLHPHALLVARVRPSA